MTKKLLLSIVVMLLALPVDAQEKKQSFFKRVDSLLTKRYRRGNIDTAYVIRPETKWTVSARLNFSGSMIESEGIDNGEHFRSEIKADYKKTVSLAVSYMGLTLSAALNPAKLLGKYHDYELNISSYGKRFGFDFSYQNAKNFSGWRETDGIGREDLPEDQLSVKTLNANAFYNFNHRRFSYPAAFSQSYIQQRSAGSFQLAVSAMGQNGKFRGDSELDFKITNIGIGAGYGYNFVPTKKWLFHISALPTFIVYSNTSLTLDGDRIPLKYHFPEVIITGRGAIVRQLKKRFVGLSMVYTFTNNGDEDNLALHNIKWRARAFFGFRL